MNINKTVNGNELAIALEGRLDTATSPLLEAELSRVDGQILSRSLTPTESEELFVLTLRAHCLENIAVCKEPEG